jgi:UDP-glucose 4-epimerase
VQLLVTGATGFVGAHLTRRLLANGHRVTALDYAPNAAALDGSNEQLTLHKGDVRDVALMRDLFETHHIDSIVHLAYLLPPETESAPERALEINVMGLHNILVMAHTYGVRRVVWASSMGVYGPSHRYSEQPVDEDAPTYPTSLYGATKVMSEALAQHYAEAFGLDVIGVRANLVYGPGRVRGLGEFKIWSRDLFESAVRGIPVVVPFGDQLLDWIYVTDYVRGFELALEATTPNHKVFNILGEWRSVRDAAAAVQEISPDVTLTVEDGVLPPDRQPPAFDGMRAAVELGYTPHYSLENGAKAYIEWLGQHG